MIGQQTVGKYSTNHKVNKCINFFGFHILWKQLWINPILASSIE